MALSAFDDKQTPPSTEALDEMLGRPSAHWHSLIADLQSKYGPLGEEWNFAGKSFGWSFRLKQPKRVFVYLTPGHGQFLASFVLGEKAWTEALAGRLPVSIVELLEAAPKYAEGRGVRIPVRTKSDADAIRKLAAIKAAH